MEGGLVKKFQKRKACADPCIIFFEKRNISHFLIPVITDSRKMVLVLQWAITEIQKRLRTLSETGTKSLGKYNDRAWGLKSSETIKVLTCKDFSPPVEKKAYPGAGRDSAPFIPNKIFDSAALDEQNTNLDLQYNQEIMREIAKSDYAHGPYFEEESFAEPDELLPSAIEVVVETGMASVSMLQRRLKLGYSRAARLVDQMGQLWSMVKDREGKERKGPRGENGPPALPVLSAERFRIFSGLRRRKIRGKRPGEGAQVRLPCPRRRPGGGRRRRRAPPRRRGGHPGDGAGVHVHAPAALEAGVLPGCPAGGPAAVCLTKDTTRSISSGVMKQPWTRVGFPAPRGA